MSKADGPTAGQFETVPDGAANPDGSAHPGAPSPLTGVGLTLSYDRVEISHDLSVSIPRGSFTVIVGPNGCGKSTLLRALARTLTPKAGRVELEGKEITSYGSKEVARLLSLLPQSPVTPEAITVRDLVGRGRYAYQTMLRQWAAADTDAVNAALAATGTADLASRRVSDLSGGQRQRVGIARSLALQPAALIADEITSGLDVSAQARIVALLQELRRDTGLALIFISHDLSLVRSLCDEVLILRRGVVVEQGASAQIFAQPAHDYTRALLDAIPLPVPDPQWLAQVSQAFSVQVLMAN